MCVVGWVKLPFHIFLDDSTYFHIYNKAYIYITCKTNNTNNKQLYFCYPLLILENNFVQLMKYWWKYFAILTSILFTFDILQHPIGKSWLDWLIFYLITYPYTLKYIIINVLVYLLVLDICTPIWFAAFLVYLDFILLNSQF